jgi:hypothetical protein
MHKKFVWLLFFLCAPAHARYEAILLKEYAGAHPDAYIAKLDRVRLLTRQAQVEVSARLGLIQYREGFQWPLLVRFDDSAPPGIENALAYVRLSQSAKGFVQELVVNLSAAEKYPGDFDKIFYHEMTHAVLNDALGGQAATLLPHWVQEGLAQFVSEEGKERLSSAAARYKRSQVGALLHPLNGVYAAHAYPQYYLAIEYLYEKHSVNSVQALVRNLIQGKSVVDAIAESTGLTWDKFHEEVQIYSLKVLQDKALPDL